MSTYHQPISKSISLNLRSINLLVPTIFILAYSVKPNMKHETSVHLSIIFRKVFETSVLPQVWKDAHITPLFKKGDRNKANNYRPISLTCITVKVFEKIIKDHVLSHLLSNNLLSPYQHGFRPGHSCVTNLFTVLDTWTQALDDGIAVDNIYLDFAKAFDKVPHKRLLVKLAAYGINGKVLSWLETSSQIEDNAWLLMEYTLTAGYPSKVEYLRVRCLPLFCL